MTFRAQMQVSPSKAEIDLLIELAKRDLLKHMDNLGTTIVFMGAGIYVKADKEKVSNELIGNSIGFTIPDFCFLRNHNLLAYLDGPVHLRSRIQAKDEEKDRLSRSCGLEPLRFPFKNWSETRKNEIADELEAKLT